MFVNILLGNLIYAAATKATGSIETKRPFLAKYIGQGKITTSQQLDLAITYLKKNAGLPEINAEEFEKSCGVNKSSFFIYKTNIMKNEY